MGLQWSWDRITFLPLQFWNIYSELMRYFVAYTCGNIYPIKNLLKMDMKLTETGLKPYREVSKWIFQVSLTESMSQTYWYASICQLEYPVRIARESVSDTYPIRERRAESGLPSPPHKCTSFTLISSQRRHTQLEPVNFQRGLGPNFVLSLVSTIGSIFFP
jgi:hypothetical protein